MQVTKQEKAKYNDIIKIQIDTQDYQPAYEAQIKKYSKELNLKGFRKGHAPIGLVQKEYGKSILANELNQLADKALGDYIQENKIKILGRPMMASEELIDIQPNENKTYEFDFEIAYEPDFTIDPSGCKLTRYEIKVTPEMVDKEVTNLKNHFAVLKDTEGPIEGDDTFYFTFDNGKSLQGESFASINDLTEEGKKQFEGKKVGDEVMGVANQLFDATKFDVNKYILNITADQAEKLEESNESVTYKITNVKKKEATTELSAEQIQQLTRDESKSTLEELKIQIEDDIKRQYANVAMSYMQNDMYDYIIDHTKMELPEDFLKRWLVSEEKNNLTTEQVNSEFDKIEKSIKWDLIKYKYAQDENVEVKPEDIRHDLRHQYVNYFMQAGFNPPEEQLNQYLDQAMKDQKTVTQTYEKLLDDKVLEAMITKAQITPKTITEEEFVQETKTRNEKSQSKLA